MGSIPLITRTAINQYIEKFNPPFPRKTVEKRLEIAARNPASSRVFRDGRSYAQIKMGNGHDVVCYAVFEDGSVVDILTKQEYGQNYRIR